MHSYDITVIIVLLSLLFVCLFFVVVFSIMKPVCYSWIQP